MERSQYSIEEIKKLWQQEPRDDCVLKAATQNKNEYPPEIQTIIEEEAILRGLLKKRNEESSSPEKLPPDEQIKSTEKKLSLTQKLPKLIGTGLSFVLFLILYEYFGLSLSIPVIGFFLCLLIANKLLPPAEKPMLIAIALQSGFVLSYSFIAILAGQFKGPAMWELLFIAGAVVWLIVCPSIGPVVLLTLLHLLSLLAIALAVFFQLELRSLNPTYKSLLLNLIFRVPAIIFMYIGLRSMRREQKATGNVITSMTLPRDK